MNAYDTISKNERGTYVLPCVPRGELLCINIAELRRRSLLCVLDYAAVVVMPGYCPFGTRIASTLLPQHRPPPLQSTTRHTGPPLPPFV